MTTFDPTTSVIQNATIVSYPRLYRISQTVNGGFDTYDSAVVVAMDEESARRIHPNGRVRWNDRLRMWGDSGWNDGVDEWCCDLANVKVEPIGIAGPGFKEGAVICASFKAG